jgi:DNA-directed RNA polymerase subunit F
MAKILANAGLTDVRQLGVKQEVVPAQYFESGEIPEHTVNRYYNKETGQDLGNLGGTYAERQTGNFFGGTFEGKGNTGYGVQFRPDGTPVFYTQGASSNDVAKIMEMAGPVGQIAAAYFGGPAAVAAIAAASGKPVGDIIKSAALSYLGNAAGSAVSGMEGITDVLGKTGTDIVSNAAKQYVGSGGKVDPLAALLSGSVNAGVNSLLPSLGLDDLTKAQKGMLSSGIMGLVNGQPLDKVLMNAAVSALTAKPDDKLKSGFGPGDPDEFIASLIPGYFQPGGEGYIPPEEEDPVTVQQQPSGLDDFLSQLEQFKQSAVTPDDIKEIISGQNFATPEDIQNAISNIPAGLTEEDLVKSLGTTKEDLLAQLGTTEEDLQQRIADLESEFGGQITGATQGLESKIAGTQDSVDALAESLGTTKDDLLNELGITEEGLQQRIADLESEFGGQLTDTTAGLESKIANLDDDFSAKLEESLGTTRDDLLAELGITEEGINQRIADLESEYGGSIDDIAKNLDITREDLLSELGVTEEEVNQRITDLESEYGSNFDDIESSLGKTREELLSELGVTEEEVNQRISDLEAEYGTNFDDIESSLGKTREELLAELGVTEEEMNQRISDLESEYGSNFEDIEGSLEKTREELLAEFGLSEEEMAQRIADLEAEFGGQLTSGLGKQSAEIKALFQNLLNRQQSQAAALAKSQAAAAAKAKADSVARAQSEAASSKNNQLQALLAMMSSNNEVAKIKSYKDLFGEDLFGTDIDLTPVGGEAE